MASIKRALAGGLLSLLIIGLYGAGAGKDVQAAILDRISGKRMLNVEYTELSSIEPESSAVDSSLLLPAISTGPMTAPSPSPAVMPLPEMESVDMEAAPEAAKDAKAELIQETTIRGGLSIKNETAYQVDAADMVSAGLSLTLPYDQPQILIIHTHSSEAYTQAGLDRYEPSDANRTENTEFNIVRIGDELAAIFQQAGLGVIHDRGIYDYPSYTGSYTRSGEAVSQYLKDYPSIAIVLDIHRDALGSDGVVYKTMAEEEGVCASQIMLLVGTDESGLEHKHWRDNLALALYLQNAANSGSPTLMRPVDLVPQRYNQHLSPGSLIMEVGSSGNTLQEALAAIRLFGNSAAPALLALVEQAPAE